MAMAIRRNRVGVETGRAGGEKDSSAKALRDAYQELKCDLRLHKKALQRLRASSECDIWEVYIPEEKETSRQKLSYLCHKILALTQEKKMLKEKISAVVNASQ
jgi:hypothetical protein